jgi:trehalose 6-phosphate synthase
MLRCVMSRLVVVSNRVGPLSDEGKAGGLAVGLADALRTRGGIWFGWSGEESAEGTFGPLHLTEEGAVSMATLDMTPADVEEFYGGFANQTLWPILHYRLDLADFDRRYEDAYKRVNERMAERLMPMLEPGDLVWVHDYHFLLFGAELREAGFDGPLGFFLHVPFPGPELLMALPNARAIVRAMLAYDLIGFQTETDRRNFARFLREDLGGRILEDGWIEVEGRRVRAGAFPIGIDAAGFAKFADSAEAKKHEKQLRDMLGDRQQIVGVDRLDYSKGIPDRLRAFERLLRDYPENRGRVSMLQVAPLSRSELEAYAELRRELEELAGRINGIYAQLNWTPVRIMTRPFTRKALAGIYRASRVGLVTPLRDGMNLVAKEYVAAQNPEDPGVLVLSCFAGAVEQLREALIVNPYDASDVAGALQAALRMPLAERRERWQALNECVQSANAQAWCESFLQALESSAARVGKAEEAASRPMAAREPAPGPVVSLRGAGRGGEGRAP